MEKKLVAKWGKGFFLGQHRRKGEAIVGTARRASTIKRVGVHRRWGAEGPSEIRGLSWNWNPEAHVQPGDIRERFLAEKEKVFGRPDVYEGEKKIYRMQLRREEFLKYGYAE